MAIANYVIRRGDFYAWRRVYCGKAIQAPLSTTSAAEARRLATVATAAAALGWPLLDTGRVTVHDAKVEILNAVRYEAHAVSCSCALILR
ncbi:MAG: hypothetical protein Q4G24_14040 [Paracoccus sp. (in: a-proteobacteria)]|uniref:hypothetical protein n=1 Tax=Paracoccus sp. TaxID=267 RepID=UPI0026E0C39E|nr:hypothetical protein [Paracoccus sp. (in: a-proteobacteria)]MDO5622578.1 hypothetical protein [Paracoccus sp. (in: a-proteobacteria)]